MALIAQEEPGAAGFGYKRSSWQNDGVVSADGYGGGYWYGGNGLVLGGGGSGGSISLVAAQLSGSGSIHANGGGSGAGGGGGRVAIYYGDKSGYVGTVAASGGAGDGVVLTGMNTGGGAGTVYWKKDSDLYVGLVIDNGGVDNAQWTMILANGILRLKSLAVAGRAHFSTSAGLRVVAGNPASFTGLISSNYLQVGSLLVSNTWVFGDVIEPVMGRSNGVPVVTVYCQPQKTYLLLATTNFLDWSLVATFSPTGSSFTFADTNAPSFGRRFFRAVMVDYLFDRIGISFNRTNQQTRLNLNGVQTNHTLVLQASDDLRHWIPVTTLIPVAVTNWQFLDTSAPSFQKRFYRAVGQGR